MKEPIRVEGVKKFLQVIFSVLGFAFSPNMYCKKLVREGAKTQNNSWGSDSCENYNFSFSTRQQFPKLAHIPAVLGYAISSQRHLCNELTIFCPRHFAFEIARREVRHELHGISARKNRKVKIALISKLGSSQYCVKQLQNCKRKVSTFDHDARLKKL